MLWFMRTAARTNDKVERYRFPKYRLNRSRLSNTERCGRVGRRSSREYYIFNKLINLNNYKLIYYRDYCK